ncbi:carbohydrate ABC transporter substrate-binding protein [Lachnoanaerobaculum gingivalis]|uniref:Carbohydrate ABC transporter substrate-binding protein n=1 Tax=Lachnoanaerobaculum gingivalis TaxID=2490855 RepID=A0A3P3QW52_9FIRM|nr:ABC transporter substrate-binding protein [Lachnoanaerobaculum gingivalis]RRJ25506.1 carbohydrate ABC transporter substrate-binding protein [Lachnoanaerobaculum gingivalis]
MKNKVKKLLLLMWILLICFMLSGCEKEKKKVTITVIHSWGGTEADHVAMRQIYEQFQNENPDINLRLISMPTRNETLRKVEDMIMVGDTPDIIAFSGMGENSIYNFMVENNMALDIQPYLEEDSEFDRDISKTNKKYWTTKAGNLYTVVDVLSLSGGYWYNEEILEKAGVRQLPGTWNEFIAMCDRINEWAKKESAEVKPLRPSAEGYLYFMDHMLFSEKDSISEISDEDFVDTLKKMESIYHFSTFENTSYSYRDETRLFNEGRLAIYVNGVWGAPMISEKIHAKYALLPTKDGISMSCESASLGYVLGKSGSKEREDASVRFLKYILSEKVQIQILERTEQFPANPNISLEKYKNEKNRMYQAATLVLDAERKIEIPDNVWSASQKEYFTDNIFKVLTNEMDKQELVDNIDKRIR